MTQTKKGTGFLTLAEFCSELSPRVYAEAPMPPLIKGIDTIEFTRQAAKWISTEYPHIFVTEESKPTEVNRLYEMCMFPIIFNPGTKFKYPKTDIVIFEMESVVWDDEVATIKMHGGEQDGETHSATFENLWYPFKTGEYVLVEP